MSWLNGKKTISQGTTTKITNKYDEHGGVNKNGTEEGLSLMLKKLETLVKAVREDGRIITGVNISKDKKLNIYEATTKTIQILLTNMV